MSYNVKNYLEDRITDVYANDREDEQHIHDAFEIIDMSFRYTHPEIFEKVDAIKNSPGRSVSKIREVPLVIRGECKWCGESMGKRKGFCGEVCEKEYKEWAIRRKTRECLRCGNSFLLNSLKEERLFCKRLCKMQHNEWLKSMGREPLGQTTKLKKEL